MYECPCSCSYFSHFRNARTPAQYRLLLYLNISQILHNFAMMRINSMFLFESAVHLHNSTRYFYFVVCSGTRNYGGLYMYSPYFITVVCRRDTVIKTIVSGFSILDPNKNDSLSEHYFTLDARAPKENVTRLDGLQTPQLSLMAVEKI